MGDARKLANEIAEKEKGKWMELVGATTFPYVNNG